MSSRASFDIIQKAALAGIPAVATLGAASSLAASLATRAGLALYAFLRPGSVVAIRSDG
jgi:FdhD protein